MDKPFGIRINLINGLKIDTDDIFANENQAVNQMINYGRNGYYSKGRKEYFPAYRIDCMSLLVNVFTHENHKT